MRTYRILPALLLVASLASAQQLNDANFETVLRAVRPAPEELEWQRVGWQPTLWHAVIEAHEARKPILLWTMNGHPLGHT